MNKHNKLNAISFINYLDAICMNFNTSLSSLPNLVCNKTRTSHITASIYAYLNKYPT